MMQKLDCFKPDNPMTTAPSLVIDLEKRLYIHLAFTI